MSEFPEPIRFGARTRERTLSVNLAAESEESEGFHAPTLDDFFPPMLFGDGTWWGMDRLMLMRVVVIVLVVAFFAYAMRNPKIVPVGVQRIAENALDYVRVNIAEEILGVANGRKFMPIIASIFFATIFLNLTSILPFLNISSNARIGMPMVMAGVVYITYVWVGVAKFGFFRFVKSSIVLPGVPLPVHFLLVPIEFLSTFVLRPFTLTVRLMANMLAGHIMLVLFFSASQYFFITEGGLWSLAGIPSIAAGVAFTFFELLVIGLQAYIFALLAAVYIDQSLHADSH